MALHVCPSASRSRDVTAAQEQVAEAYAADKTLKDGYARIAWAHFYKKQDYASIRLWIERDEKDRELSPNWQLKYARVIAKTEGIEAALPMIEKACNEEPKLENAYCSIAWEHYVPKDHAFEKAIPYFEKDYRREHLSGGCQVHYAVALSFMGREYEAEKFVENAYKANNQLVNGFARCGWVRYFYCGYAPERALRFFYRDHKLRRLRNYVHRYATILGAVDDQSSALTIIEHSYDTDAQAHSGYSCLGWQLYVVRRNNPEKTFTYFDKDQQNHRYNPSHAGIFFAGLHACTGDRNIAEQLVAEYYDNDCDLNAGNMFVGFCDYVCNQDLEYLLQMCNKDQRLGRIMFPEHGYLHAAVLIKCGKYDHALTIIKSISKRSCFIHQIATTWLMVNFPNGKMLVDAFVTPVLKGMLDDFKSKTDLHSSVLSPKT